MPSTTVQIADSLLRHSLYVTQRDDLVDVDPWSRDQLYAAVTTADKTESVVVLGYGQEQLYLAAPQDLAYLPPRALGVVEGPGLQVDSPYTYSPSSGEVTQLSEAIVVAPEFDILILAFDWPEPDSEWIPPKMEYREQSSGHSTGIPGG